MNCLKSQIGKKVQSWDWNPQFGALESSVDSVEEQESKVWGPPPQLI